MCVCACVCVCVCTPGFRLSSYHPVPTVCQRSRSACLFANLEGALWQGLPRSGKDVVRCGNDAELRAPKPVSWRPEPVASHELQANQASPEAPRLETGGWRLGPGSWRLDAEEEGGCRQARYPWISIRTIRQISALHTMRYERQHLQHLPML